jgi:hypothetical protein
MEMLKINARLGTYLLSIKTDGQLSSQLSDLRQAKIETKHSDVYRNHARAIGHPSLLWSLVSVKTTIVRIGHLLVAFSEMGYTKANHVNFWKIT